MAEVPAANRGPRPRLAAGLRGRRVLGSVLYLGVVAGLVFALVSVFSPYLVRQPSRGQVGVALNPPAVAGSGAFGNPSILATWEGPEQAAFANVLGRFQQQYGISVSYTSSGQELPLVLGSELSKGSAPDVAILPQPGELADLADQGKLVPLDGIVDRRQLDDMNGLWQGYARRRGRLYGVYFKASNKSVIWYRPDLFRRAGIDRVPATWDELLADDAILRTSGIVPFAMCGASAWTLTDWFENLYLQTAGTDDYQKLARHAGMRWTDPTVAQALRLMAGVFGPGDVAGGLTGALATPYPDCVNQVFAGGQAAMVFEGNFVQSQIRSLGPTRAGPGGQYDFFPFPAVSPGASASVVVGGDVAVLLRDTPQARDLIEYLATPGAGRAWASQGGFISPHRAVGERDYPGAVSQALAAPVTDRASRIEFDMSDQAPAAFGSTVNGGEWAAFQQWLVDPSAIEATQQRLEREAERDYPAD